MTTYILTVSTDALGLGIISGGRVVVERRRTSAAQQYPGFDVLYAITTYTNTSGVATLGLKPDDSSVYHEARIYDTSGVVVYRTIFSMLPENIALLDVTGAILGENSIQFKDEGVNLGTPVATNNIDFTGNAVTASFADGTITVNITKPTTAADISAEPAGAVTTHTGAVDPHGDRAYADSLVVGLWDDRGNYDASVNAYPSSGGSGTAGAILKGDIWTVSVGGTLPTAQAVGVGDTVRALIDSPGNTQGNWAIQEQNIGYTPENSANKSTSAALGTSDTLYPSQKAVKGYVDTSIAALNTPPNISTTFQRGQKFGNHSYLGHSVPVDGPYKGSSPGSTPIYSITLVEALTNRGNIADCTLWEMNSNTIDTATDVSLYAFASSTIYPQEQWRTGAKLQYLASLALYNVIPTTENFCYRIGLANGANSDHRSADPWAGTGFGTGNEHTGCAAMFIADNTSTYWQCKSGRKTDTQTTVTAVPYVLGEFAVFHIVVTTTGAVEFRINGTLVATHSGLGVIPDGAYLSEGVGVRNIAATTTAKKGFWLDEFVFRHELPGSRTGFAFT